MTDIKQLLRSQVQGAGTAQFDMAFRTMTPAQATVLMQSVQSLLVRQEQYYKNKVTQDKHES